MKWMQLIHKRGGLNVTQQELSTAPIGTVFPIKYCLDTKDISETNWANCILKKLSTQGIFEIEDLVDIEEKAKTLDWGGDDGLGNMWDLFFKNPTFDELDTVCHALGVAVDWCHFEVDDDHDKLPGDDDNTSFGTSVEEGDHHQDEAVGNIIDMKGQQNVFSMKDKDGNLRRDHHKYRKLVSSWSIFAYNYWWLLGFPGIRESLHFFNSCHHLYL
jgi:hypothetical protein